MPKHIVIFSHGFGVRRDGRGLFTAIAEVMPNVQTVMFDYSHVDEATNTLTVTPLDVQAAQLTQVIAQTRVANPTATIDLVGHSLGCVIAALANPSGIRKTILTAPPADISAEGKIKRWKERFNISFNRHGTTRVPRRDGTTTIVKEDYWRSLDGIDAQTLYNSLAQHTQLTIITASQDDVLDDSAFTKLATTITVHTVAADHNFTGTARKELCALVAHELI